MITVDLSNIWTQASLPELLALEPELTCAHTYLAGQGEGQTPPPWLTGEPVLAPVTEAAAAIRQIAPTCVILAPEPECLGAKGVLQALPGQDIRLIFAGSSFSTNRANRLLRELDEGDFSLVVLSPDGTAPETAIALRNLRWLLERKHGTQEAAKRIFAVTAPGGLMDTAKEQSWRLLPWQTCKEFPCLTNQWLLPMAVAGIDIESFAEGTLEARSALASGSFENPLWLYAAVGELMRRQGMGMEVLATAEPDLAGFGLWWQSLKVPGDCFPATASIPGIVPWAGSFVTLLRPEPPEKPCFIDADWKNRDGLAHLEGKPLDTVAWQACQDVIAGHCDAGVPVLTMDCPPVSARTMGELAGFFSLSQAFSRLLRLGVPETEAPDKNEL